MCQGNNGSMLHQGGVLKKLRTAHKMSQEELGQRLGLSQEAISQREASPSLDGWLIAAIGREFGISPSVFFQEEPLDLERLEDSTAIIQHIRALSRTLSRLIDRLEKVK